METQYIARRVAKLIDSPDHPDNQPVSEIKGLNDKIRRKIESLMPGLRRANVLSMQLQETKDRFGLNDDEAVHLRRAALGLEGPIPEPKDRWDPPSQRVKHRVPNLVGLPLADARRLLREENLRSGETTHRDSDQPNDIVLRQDPAADEEVKGGTAVNMVLSTGLSVRIPDVVGKPLSEAICMLRNAGLRSEPELKFVPRRKQPKHIVLDVSPNARTYVAPHARVILRISGG